MVDDIDYCDCWIASHLFVTGGTFFTLSRLAMQYRYFLNPSETKYNGEEKDTLL